MSSVKREQEKREEIVKISLELEDMGKEKIPGSFRKKDHRQNMKN